jgi:hypothetical protein
MTTAPFKKSKSKSNPAASGGPKNNPKKESTAQQIVISRFYFQAHPALESSLVFRLILRWNQITSSGSLSDWKMLGANWVCR